MASPAAIVVAVMVSCSVPPPVRVAVTVIEYSVPSSRPVSVYIVSLSAISEMVLQSEKQSVLVFEYEMVKAVAVTSSLSTHEMIKGSVDNEADTFSPSKVGHNQICF